MWRRRSGRLLDRLLGWPAHANGGAPRLAAPTHAVGYTVRTFEAEDHRGERVDVGLAIWYPADEEPAPHTYQLGDNQVESRVVVDGAAAAGRFPLVLFSHGATGTGLNALFLTERLASRGFVVAAPDYADELFAARILGPQPTVRLREALEMARWVKELRDDQLEAGGTRYRRARLGYRPRSAVLALSRVIAEALDPASPLRGAIDVDRIAAIGHSFGAWTSLLLAGADPCFADPRVRAVVSLSGPSGAHVFEPGELESIRLPVMFMYGEREPEAGRASDRRNYYDRARPPKILVEIEDADHFTFSGGIRHEFHTVRDYLERDPRRATLVRYVEAFADHFLRGAPGALGTLASGGSGVSGFACELAVATSAA